MKPVSSYCMRSLVLLAFSAWSSMVAAISYIGLPEVKAAGITRTEIRVAIDAWPPFRILNEESYSGIDFDLWTRLADALELKIDYVRCPWIRCLKMMEDGNVDAMGGLALRPERAVYMEYLKPPYYRCSTVFYVRKGERQRIRSYQDLYQIDVGIVSGSAYFQTFDHDQKIHKVNVSTEKQLVDMLGRDRLAAIIGTDCQADYEIAQSPYNDVVEKAEFRPGNSVDLYFAISKKSPYRAHAEMFSKALRRLLNNGAIDEIRNAYLAPDAKPVKR
ncbi:amino acid ABC transporter substrate-binding protein [Hahella sp. CCB-MM4]|uniref:substrate-binding periplasmic protein n=1 Tax=Hahella sp. (strain CCB-MM4) TaxID=1926491 RepID=UPI000B9C12B7|nr:transporter substrate-binding domain-containing protein [Hahella sp. CCB-MM4]OZG71396.1 amino acid ABC transporter substrate-binding protein [Hahella sp. CCB-MM4]